MKKVQHSQGYYIALYIILIIIFLIILFLINLREKYKIQYDWWYNNNGKTYDKYLNLTNVLIARDSFILYYITKIFGNIFSDLDRDQIGFLFTNVLPFNFYKGKDGKELGFVLPRHVTQDIRFRYGDNAKFDSWCDSHTYNTDVVLKYDSNGNREGGNMGVYPASNDRRAWQYKFKEWGVPLECYVTKSGLQVPDLNNPTYPNIYDDWFKTQDHPDNFLAMYGILPDSPLCISFINDGYNDTSGLILDTESFEILLGKNTDTGNVGGWVGYLEGLGNNNMNKYDNFLHSSYVGKSPPKKPSIPCNGGSAANWGSSIASGAGIGMLALFPGVGTFAAGAAILFGLLTFALTSPIANPGC